MKRAERSRRAAQVRLHPRHARLALDLQPAGVEGDALAHQRGGTAFVSVFVSVALVAQVHQRGLAAVARRRRAHPDDTAEPAGDELFFP